jgi:hypothetical protein
MTSKRPGRLDWIETIEVERVDDDSEVEQQSRSTNGGGSTAPILRKQRTTSSNDHTSDGESSTEELAGVAIIDRDTRNAGHNARNTPINHRSNSDLGTTSSEDRLANIDTDSQQDRRRRLRVAFLSCLLLLFIIAIVAGGVCGAGKCPRGRRSSAEAAQIELNPELYNDVCERAVGPLTIGKVPSIGSLKGVTTTSNVPSCGSSSSNTNGTTASTTTALGRWFKVTGGDEVIRASTCNRGEMYTTSIDTTLTIFQGDDCGSLTCVVSNDDFCGESSSASLLAKKGLNYYIFVAKKDNEDDANISSFLSTASNSSSSNGVGSPNYDFVLTVDFENNGSCENAIGPIVSAGGSIIPGSLRASTSPQFAMTCDSNAAQDGVVWYTVRAKFAILRKPHTIMDIQDKLVTG